MKWSTYNLLHVYNNVGDLVKKPINLIFSKKFGICHKERIKNTLVNEGRFFDKEDKHTPSSTTIIVRMRHTNYLH